MHVIIPRVGKGNKYITLSPPDYLPYISNAKDSGAVILSFKVS